MAHAGARVILTSRKVEAGQEVARQLQSSGVKVEFWPATIDACSSGVYQLQHKLQAYCCCCRAT